MEKQIQKMGPLPAVLLCPGLPMLLYAMGDFPRRTMLKESLSILTILAFCFMLLQFFLARSNRPMLSGYKMSGVVKIHKIIGYIFVSVLLVHPFLLVVPRYFESGVDPVEALFTILTTWDSTGVVVGIIGWCLMLILGVTSLLRKRLPITYKTWRIFHGSLALVFIALSTWHVVDLGRHTTQPLAIYMIFGATCGVLLLLKTYLLPSPQKAGNK